MCDVNLLKLKKLSDAVKDKLSQRHFFEKDDLLELDGCVSELATYIDELYEDNTPPDRETKMSDEDWNDALLRWKAGLKTPAPGGEELSLGIKK